jgi:molybdopterin adenylyltransferase
MTIRFAILTVSDRSASGQRADASGPALEQFIQEQTWQVILRDVIPDDLEQIKQRLVSWVDSQEIDILLTTGGTGFSPRDVTPEATLAVIERITPGLSEAMRAASLQITPHAMLSRACAGIRGETLIINLPGSPKAAVECLQVLRPVLAHAVQLLTDDPRAEISHRES